GRVAANTTVLVPVNRVAGVDHRVLQSDPVRAVVKRWAIERSSLGTHVEPVSVHETSRRSHIHLPVEINCPEILVRSQPDLDRLKYVSGKEPRGERHAVDGALARRYGECVADCKSKVDGPGVGFAIDRTVFIQRSGEGGRNGDSEERCGQQNARRKATSHV